jgi:hypothetical protein
VLAFTTVTLKPVTSVVSLQQANATTSAAVTTADHLLILGITMIICYSVL